MEHLTDKELLQLLEQDHGEQVVLPEHLQQCAACQQRWQDLAEPWEALGHWTTEPPQIDLTERILAQTVKASTITLWQTQAWIRMAASIIIGVGLGAWMGRTQSTPVSAEQASQAIYLEALALHSSTGWTTPLLDESQEP